MRTRWWLLALAAVISTSPAAEKKYGPGVSDTEIKLGQTVPYSGPVSAYGAIGKSEAAYFEMLNQQGGVNGRKIRLISIDDGYSPPKTVEQTRRLVEQENVLAIFSPVGTPTSSATHKYLNAKKVPQILIQSAANKWNDPGNFPWSMSWSPNAHSETRVFGKICSDQAASEDHGIYRTTTWQGSAEGLRQALGASRADDRRTASYEVTDRPSIRRSYRCKLREPIRCSNSPPRASPRKPFARSMTWAGSHCSSCRIRRARWQRRSHRQVSTNRRA